MAGSDAARQRTSGRSGGRRALWSASCSSAAVRIWWRTSSARLPGSCRSATMQATQRVESDPLVLVPGGRSRTADTGIFSPLLCSPGHV